MGSRTSTAETLPMAYGPQQASGPPILHLKTGVPALAELHARTGGQGKVLLGKQELRVLGTEGPNRD